MSKQQWLMKKQTKPPVSWDGKTKTFSIALKGLKGVIEGDGIEAEWSPSHNLCCSYKGSGFQQVEHWIRNSYNRMRFCWFKI